MPAISPPDVVVAAYRLLMLFPVTVPMFAFPEVTAIPQSIPFVVEAPLEVYSANPAIVLF